MECGEQKGIRVKRCFRNHLGPVRTLSRTPKNEGGDCPCGSRSEEYESGSMLSQKQPHDDSEEE